MRRRALPVAVTAATLLGAATLAISHVEPAHAERSRSGKVVRVERPKAIISDRVEICPFDPSGDDGSASPKVMCFGDPPRVGARIEFVDDSGYRGSGRVLRSEPGLPMFSHCKENAGHTVYFEWTSGGGGDPAAPYGSSVVGVLGVKLSPQGAKLLNSPDRRPPEGDASSYAIGLDADGDTHADVVVLVRECHDKAGAAGGAGGSRNQPVFCLDYWLYGRDEWKLANQAVVHSCY